MSLNGRSLVLERVSLGAEGIDLARAVLADGFKVEQRACAGAAPQALPEAGVGHRASRGRWRARP